MVLFTTLRNTGVPVQINVVDSKHFEVSGDTSKQIGILHFTQEWEFRFKMREDRTIVFSGGWEIASENIEYCAHDVDFFKYRHPGVIEDIEDYMRNIFLCASLY